MMPGLPRGAGMTIVIQNMAFPRSISAMLAAWLAVCIVNAGVGVGGRQARPPAPAPDKPVTFSADIAPMLTVTCQPCHYKGGKVYDHLPFDQYETVRKLGGKLNTRLKDKNADLVTRWIKGGSQK